MHFDDKTHVITTLERQKIVVKWFTVTFDKCILSLSKKCVKSSANVHAYHSYEVWIFAGKNDKFLRRIQYFRIFLRRICFNTIFWQWRQNYLLVCYFLNNLIKCMHSNNLTCRINGFSGLDPYLEVLLLVSIMLLC